MHLPLVRAPLSNVPDLILNVMIDSASSANFITLKKVSGRLIKNQVSLKDNFKTLENNVTLYVNGMNGRKELKTRRVSFKLSDPYADKLEAYVVPKIHSFPSCHLPKDIIDDYNMDGHYPRAGGEVDLLLGAVDAFKMITGRPKILDASLALVPTLYGYIPCGSMDMVKEWVHSEDTKSIFLTNTEHLSKCIEKLLSIELLPMDDAPSSLTKDEILAVNKIKEVMTLDKDRKCFTTGLLWRGEPDLKNNYYSAKIRFEALLRKLRNDPELMLAYIEAMNDYINMKVVEKVTDLNAQDPGRKDVYFLPHRAVYDALRLSTKCRIVFDASAKTGTGKSLNDCLVCGPALQLSILAIELRFRTNKVVLVGDIGKMFLQIKVREKDRDFLRFLWKDPREKGEAQIWRWNALIFGGADSPFQAISAIKQLVADKINDPSITAEERAVCDVLDKNTYVDDLTITANSVEEALQLYAGVNKLLAEGSFRVKKWASNSPHVIQHIDPETRAPTTQDVDVHGSQENVYSSDISTLGVQWQPKKDVIHFSKCKDMGSENRNTMTSVASLLAKPFDPMGLSSPFILQARIVMKKCHMSGLKWKDPLPDDIRVEWERWVAQLPELEELQFPRYVPVNDSTLYVIFSDASDVGYGACVYCHTRDESTGSYVSNLLCARSRVAPNNRMLTIPQKEMAACLVAAELGQFVCEELKVDRSRLRFFSDSEICLFQLTKPARVITKTKIHNSCVGAS